MIVAGKVDLSSRECRQRNSNLFQFLKTLWVYCHCQLFKNSTLRVMHFNNNWFSSTRDTVFRW